MKENKYSSKHNHRRNDSKPPSKPGWYWFTGLIFSNALQEGLVQSVIPPEVVRVFYINGKIFMAQLVGHQNSWPLENMQGTWSGPMAMPHMSHKTHDLWSKNPSNIRDLLEDFDN